LRQLDIHSRAILPDAFNKTSTLPLKPVISVEIAGMVKTSGTGRGFITRGPTRPGSPSRLAHWPSPFRSGAERPTLPRYIADEEREQASTKPTGVRITRGLLTKKDE
jgi:hypothetical protein